MARDGKKSVYLDAEAVDALKAEIDKWFYYKWIRLNSMSQIIIALLNEKNEKDSN